MAYRTKERAWLSKRISMGQKPDKLYRGISLFLAKPKSVVMEQKSLTSREYDRRYKFMADCFRVLDDDLRKK